jgi:hypothetical protein
MEMTFDDYIVNPMGIKNSVYSNRELYRQLYTDKLNKILVREVGKVSYTLYMDKIQDTYYILMRVPSEVIEKFYYDTVIMFYTDNPDLKLKRSLKDYYVKFYSNDPSFVYTFAHAMLENDLFIRDLVPRMSKEAVTKVATEKNPKNEIGYVKSLYFTYLLMKKDNLFEKIIYESQAEPYSKKKILETVTHADIKVKDRQEKGQELEKKKRIDSEKEKAKKNENRTLTHPSKMSNIITSIKKVPTINKVSNIKKTNKVKNI